MDTDLTALDRFVGEWEVRVDFPGAPVGRMAAGWDLDGRYLVLRTSVPDSGVPDSLSILAGSGEAFTQHYFDSRGVVRVYRTTLRGDVWTQLRTEPDFSPLEFAQRFEGRFSPDGDRIDGRWETSPDGGQTWRLDFELTYDRVF
jgi:hypothetical protein